MKQLCVWIRGVGGPARFVLLLPELFKVVVWVVGRDCLGQHCF